MTTIETLPGKIQQKVTSPIVAAIETAWVAIQREHKDLPAVAVTVSAGSLHKGPAKHGHFAAGRWVTEGQEDTHELFVAGEGLARPAAEVFATLLHEAAHALAAARNISDTSRGGRYHNAEFRDLAVGLGLDTVKVGSIGYSGTTLGGDTAHKYRAPIERLGKALTLHRRGESAGEGTGRKSNNNGAALTCGCAEPRKIRASLSVIELGPILCGLCEQEFQPAE